MPGNYIFPLFIFFLYSLSFLQSLPSRKNLLQIWNCIILIEGGWKHIYNFRKSAEKSL